MRNTHDSRYIFSAYSNSVGAVLHQPLKAFLSDVPCAALPVTGGFISQVKENIEFRIDSMEILRIGRASSSVLGERRNNQYVSFATSTVEKLTILDVITADAVVSRVTSVYPAAENRQSDDDPRVNRAKLYLSGSHFDNLKIDGKRIQCEGEPSFQDRDGFSIQTADAQRRSLFTDACHEIFIPQFGTIYLGEVDIYSSKISVTMLRVELGCPFAGSVAAGNSSTNGRDG